MGADTLNDDYAVILRSRALAAFAKAKEAEANSQFSLQRHTLKERTLNSQLKSAYDFQTRYAALSKAVSDSLHRSEAHDYAARYHAQEQQLEIQEHQAKVERSHLMSLAIAVVALLAIAFALYFFRQKRIVTDKNRALVRMINEQHGVPPTNGGTASARGQSLNSQFSIFNSIDSAIRADRLYANMGLQRQDICDRFGISRHALNDLLTAYADGQSFPQYVNNIRLEEALRLLRDAPSKTLSAIATDIGFTPANLREQFKRKYGVTPAEYRRISEEKNA